MKERSSTKRSVGSILLSLYCVSLSIGCSGGPSSESGEVQASCSDVGCQKLATCETDCTYQVTCQCAPLPFFNNETCVHYSTDTVTASYTSGSCVSNAGGSCATWCSSNAPKCPDIYSQALAACRAACGYPNCQAAATAKLTSGSSWTSGCQICGPDAGAP